MASSDSIETRFEPLEVSKNDRANIKNADGDIVAMCYANGIDARETYELARLLAAAPELYEALKLAHGWLDEVSEKRAYHVPTTVLVDIEAALAKATGERA